MNYVMSILELTPYGAALLVVGYLLKLAKPAFESALKFLASLLLIKVELLDDTEAVPIYLATHFAKTTLSGRTAVQGRAAFVRELRRDTNVMVESRVVGTFAVYWRGWRPIVERVSIEDKTTCRSLWFVRGTFDLDRLMRDAVMYYATVVNGKKNRDELKRFQNRSALITKMRPQKMTTEFASPSAGYKTMSQSVTCDTTKVWGFSKPELAPDPIDRTYLLDRLSIQEDLREAIQEATAWPGEREWCRQRSVPWRMGWLLHGLPGTGKTSFAVAVATALNLRIYVFDLAAFDNVEFSNSWDMLQTPCMVLLEDFDAVYHGRRNVIPDRGPSFDCLLNHVAGPGTKDGIFLVVTTNHLEHVDEALGAVRHDRAGEIRSTRPGRIDRVLEMRPPDQEGLRRIAERIMDGLPRETIERVLREGAGETGAQFQDRCTTEARRWCRSRAKL